MWLYLSVNVLCENEVIPIFHGWVGHWMWRRQLAQVQTTLVGWRYSCNSKVWLCDKSRLGRWMIFVHIFLHMSPDDIKSTIFCPLALALFFSFSPEKGSNIVLKLWHYCIVQAVESWNTLPALRPQPSFCSALSWEQIRVRTEEWLRWSGVQESTKRI